LGIVSLLARFPRQVALVMNFIQQIFRAQLIWINVARALSIISGGRPSRRAIASAFERPGKPSVR